MLNYVRRRKITKGQKKKKRAEKEEGETISRQHPEERYASAPTLEE